MAKKKQTQTVADAAKKQEEARREAIDEFNRNYMGQYWIDASKIPTDEDIEAAKKDFDDAKEKLDKKSDYLIADKANAKRVAEFMKEALNHLPWKGQFFVGVVRLNDLLTDFINKFDDENPTELLFEYGAMECAHLLFKDYGGVGVESARWFWDNNEQFVPIHDTLYDLHNWRELENKKLENLNMRYAMMAQGYYMYVLEGAEQDPVESAEKTEEVEEAPKEEVAEEKK